MKNNINKRIEKITDVINQLKSIIISYQDDIKKIADEYDIYYVSNILRIKEEQLKSLLDEKEIINKYEKES
jgi:uncharacterized protein YacL (UPF0231 family)